MNQIRKRGSGGVIARCTRGSQLISGGPGFERKCSCDTEPFLLSLSCPWLSGGEYRGEGGAWRGRRLRARPQPVPGVCTPTLVHTHAHTRSLVDPRTPPPPPSLTPHPSTVFARPPPLLLAVWLLGPCPGRPAAHPAFSRWSGLVQQPQGRPRSTVLGIRSPSSLPHPSAPAAPRLSSLLPPRPLLSDPASVHTAPPARKTVLHLADSRTSQLPRRLCHFLRALRGPFRSLVSWYGFPCPHWGYTFLGVFFVFFSVCLFTAHISPGYGCEEMGTESSTTPVQYLAWDLAALDSG